MCIYKHTQLIHPQPCLPACLIACRSNDEVLRCLISLSTIFTNLHPDMLDTVMIVSPTMETKFLRSLLGIFKTPFK